MRLHRRSSRTEGGRSRAWHRLVVPSVLRGRPRVVAGVAGGVAIAVVAGVSVAVLVSGRGSAQHEVAGPFVLPSLVATPTTPPGATPVPSASGLPESVATSVAAAAQVVALPADQAIAELWRSGAPALDIDRNAQIRAVSAAPGAAIAPPPGTPATSDAVTVAAAFVNRYGEGFGLRPGQHAAVSRVDAVPGGARVVRFQQQIDGVPVMGGDVAVAVDGSGGIVTASAEAPSVAPVSASAGVPAEQASATALRVVADQWGVAADQLSVSRSALWYFDPRVLGVAGRAELRPTWWVTVASALSSVDLQSVFVDAVDGAVVLSYSELREAKSRLICDLGNAAVNLDNPATYECSDAPGGPAVVRREGGGASGVADVNQAYDLLGATYDFYLNNFGRDSVDDNGLPMRATVRACYNGSFFECPLQNAFWDGAQMVFGQGWAAADDVVGHELTHGVTDYTSQLYYFAESGGIDEGLADIMGEFLDQTRTGDNDSLWRIGEDSPVGAIRSMQNPTLFGDPDRVGGPAWSAALNDAADNYGVHHLSGVVNRAAYLLAAGGTQSSVTVTGIGVAKSMQIWYRLMFLLPSGAEMADLVTLLPYACRSVIGVAGITAADCVEASDATLATSMTAESGSGGGWTFADANDCGTAGMPSRTIFGDDFERGPGRWLLQAPWQALPNDAIPVSFANSGANSLYVFENDGNTQKPTAVLDQWITPPASGLSNLRVSWAESLLSSSGGMDLIIQSQGGAVTSTGGGTFAFSKGYAKRVANIATIPNEPFKIVLSADSQVSAANELLVDDVRVFECLPGINGAPQQLAAQLAGDATSMTVTWTAPVYTVPGDDPAQYEISVLPAPAGYTGAILVPQSTLSRTITGLTPGVVYQVVVRAIGGSGTPGEGSATYAPSPGAYNCTILAPGGGRNRCSTRPELPPIGR